MISILKYIKDFLSRSGGYVLITTIISRILSFSSSLIILYFSEETKLGVILFSWSIVSFLLPMVGLGLPQSLIRYGALSENLEKKKDIFNYVFKFGGIISILISFIFFFIGFYFPFENPKVGTYTSILGFVFIPWFFYDILRAHLRLQKNNKVYSYTEITYNIFFFLSTILFGFIYKEKGYIISILISPLLTVILFFKYFKKELNCNKIALSTFNKGFWLYGFYGGLSNLITTLLFIIDLILIGYILKTLEQVTFYRYISIIPLSILFLPRAFITTDFVAFTEKIKQKKYIKNYSKNYIFLFSIVSVFYNLTLYFAAPYILSLFGDNFIIHIESFYILNIGVCGILIFRGLYGNLLSSIGLVKLNYYISLIAVLLNIVSNYFLLPELGIKGAAITTAVLMWLTGIASFILFLRNYKIYLKRET